MSSDDSLTPLATATMPDKPTLDGIEDKWSRLWESRSVVQV